MKSLIVWFAMPLLALQTANPLSFEKEQSLGRQIAVEMRDRAPRLNNAGASNPILDAYVKSVGGHLMASLPAAPLTYSFEAIQNDAAEPLPLPGGYVLVPANFFRSARDADEFAAMIAHSIAHIALYHPQLTKTATLPLIFMGPLHMESRAGGGLAIPLGLIKLRAAQELDADQLGLELASRAGYDPRALDRYIRHTQPAASDMRFSPLPERESRLARIGQALQRLPDAPPAANDEFLRCRELAPPASARPTPKREPPSLFRGN